MSASDPVPLAATVFWQPDPTKTLVRDGNMTINFPTEPGIKQEIWSYFLDFQERLHSLSTLSVTQIH